MPLDMGHFLNEILTWYQIKNESSPQDADILHTCELGINNCQTDLHVFHSETL